MEEDVEGLRGRLAGWAVEGGHVGEEAEGDVGSRDAVEGDEELVEGDGG